MTCDFNAEDKVAVFMDICFADIQILNPEKQGSWLAVPIQPVINVTSPRLCVVQNNLINELPSSSSWVVRNLSVGLLPDAEGSRFYETIFNIENFLKVGTASFWPFWTSGKTFQKVVVSLLRESQHLMYASEMKLNVLFNKSSDLVVVNTKGDRVAPIDIATGTIITTDLVVSGLWCSTDRCGARINVKRIVVHDEVYQRSRECLLD